MAVGGPAILPSAALSSDPPPTAEPGPRKRPSAPLRREPEAVRDFQQPRLQPLHVLGRRARPRGRPAAHARHEVLEALDVPLVSDVRVERGGVRVVRVRALCGEVLARVRERLGVRGREVGEADVGEARGDRAHFREDFGGGGGRGGRGAREVGEEGGAEPAEDA